MNKIEELRKQTEEEMIEKYAKSFAESCDMYAGDGKCLEGGKCENCDRVKKFRKKLMG